MKCIWIGDDPKEMLKQATKGDVDFITGDYLAGATNLPTSLSRSKADLHPEMNIANNAQAHARGEHPGYEQTAWMGIQQTISVINEKRIKVAINGGALNPEGLACKVAELVRMFKFPTRFENIIENGIRSKVRVTTSKSPTYQGTMSYQRSLRLCLVLKMSVCPTWTPITSTSTGAKRHISSHACRIALRLSQQTPIQVPEQLSRRLKKEPT